MYPSSASRSARERTLSSWPPPSWNSTTPGRGASPALSSPANTPTIVVPSTSYPTSCLVTTMRATVPADGDARRRTYRDRRAVLQAIRRRLLQPVLRAPARSRPPPHRAPRSGRDGAGGMVAHPDPVGARRRSRQGLLARLAPRPPSTSPPPPPRRKRAPPPPVRARARRSSDMATGACLRPGGLPERAAVPRQCDGGAGHRNAHICVPWAALSRSADGLRPSTLDRPGRDRP